MYWLAPPYSQVLWVNTSNNFRESQPLTLPVNSCSRRFEVEKAGGFISFLAVKHSNLFLGLLFSITHVIVGLDDLTRIQHQQTTAPMDGLLILWIAASGGERLGLLVHFWFINWTWKSLETFNHYFTQWTINCFSLFFTLCVFACVSWKKDDWRIIDSILEPEVEASLGEEKKDGLDCLLGHGWDCVLVCHSLTLLFWFYKCLYTDGRDSFFRESSGRDVKRNRECIDSVYRQLVPVFTSAVHFLLCVRVCAGWFMFYK